MKHPKTSAFPDSQALIPSFPISSPKSAVLRKVPYPAGTASVVILRSVPTNSRLRQMALRQGESVVAVMFKGQELRDSSKSRLGPAVMNFAQCAYVMTTGRDFELSSIQRRGHCLIGCKKSDSWDAHVEAIITAFDGKATYRAQTLLAKDGELNQMEASPQCIQHIQNYYLTCLSHKTSFGASQLSRLWWS